MFQKPVAETHWITNAEVVGCTELDERENKTELNQASACLFTTRNYKNRKDDQIWLN